MFLGRVVEPGVDPQWTEEDQDKALAFEREQSKVCRSCGTRDEEWVGTSPGDPPYIGQLHHCRGCEALESERRNIQEGTEGHTTAYLVPADLAEVPDDVQEHNGSAERDPGEPASDPAV